MIKSVFILGKSGQILIEKHWRGVTSRAIVEGFWEEVCKHSSKRDVPPIISTPMYYLVSVLRHDMFFLATVCAEVPPLMVLELLSRVVKVLQGYFGAKLRESSIQENFATVYQLLEEMLDNGYPLITEFNALTSLVAPPNLGSRVMNFMTGKSSISDNLDAGALSIVPWRSSKVTHVQNEIYFDIVEEIDSITDSNNQIVSSGVHGIMQCKCRLSGMPECVLSFTDTSNLEDISFHPCVRITRFERDRVLSFVPPDGEFELMTYSVKARRPTAPVYCKPNVSFTDTGGKIDVIVGSKPMSSGGLSSMRRGAGSGMGGGKTPEATPVKDVVVILTFPKGVKSVDVEASVGAVTFPPDQQADYVVCWWNIGAFASDRSPRLTGSLSLHPGAKPSGATVTATMRFSSSGGSISNLRIKDLSVVNEAYKVKKAMRSMVRAGRVQIRG